MCLPIRHREAVDQEIFSLTQTLIVELTEYRNRPANEPRGFTDLMIARRVLGELGYAALFVAAVVEAIARPLVGAVIFLGGTYVGFVACDAEILQVSLIGMAIVVSSLYQIDVGLRCLIGLVKNIYRDRMEYPDLRLAVFELCDP